MRVFQSILLLVLSASPGAGQDVCGQAEGALQRKDLAGAEKLLKQCIGMRPESLTSYIQLCSIYQSQGRGDELFQLALKGMKRFPAEKRFYVTVGIHQAKARQYEAAADTFTKARARWPEDPKIRKYLSSTWLEKGLELLDGGKEAESAEALRKALALEPDDAEARLNLGRALYNLRLVSESLTEFDRVLSLSPELPLAHFHRGMSLLSLGEYQRAIADFDKEIETNRQYPPSFIFRAQAKMRLNDWTGALPDLEISVLRMPDNFKAHFFLGRCLEHLGRMSEAEASFRKAMELNPLDSGTVTALARLLQQTSREEEAGILFKKAAELLDSHQQEDRNLATTPPKN